MSIGLRNSTIERFRARYHEGHRVRFLALNESGDSFTLIADISKGYYMGQFAETSFNGINANLTVDLIFTEGVAVADVAKASHVDYYNPDDETIYQRYKIQTDAPPAMDEWRCVFALISAFSDKRQIV